LRFFAHDFLMLSIEEIHQLFPGRSPRAFKDRVRRLVKAGFLCERPFYPGFWMPPVRDRLFFLGKEGQRLLDPLRLDRNIQSRLRRAREFKSAALPHLRFANAIQLKFIAARHDDPESQLLSYIPQYDHAWIVLAENGFPLRPDGYLEYALGPR